MNEIIFGCAAFLVAGLVQGCTGFGFGMVAAPALALFMPPDRVAPIVILLCLFNNIVVLIETRTSVRLRMVLPLLIGGIIGLPVGGYILTSLEPGIIKIALGVIVLVLSLVMLAGWKRRVRNETAGLVPVGFISGLLSSSTSIGGPPVILFFSNQGMSKDVFRANIVAYFVLINTGAVVVFLSYGLLDGKLLAGAAIYILPVLLGSVAGVWLARRIDEQIFRRVVLVLVLLLGIALVISNIPGG